MWKKNPTNDRPKNEYLIDTLFEDMKKMDSVIKRLQREINDVRVEAEPAFEQVKSMDSHIKKLTREVHELKAQVSSNNEGR